MERINKGQIDFRNTESVIMGELSDFDIIALSGQTLRRGSASGPASLDLARPLRDDLTAYPL